MYFYLDDERIDMKLVRVVYGVTLNLGNYSSEKFELEFGCHPDEDLDLVACVKEAKIQISQVSKALNKEGKN